MASRSPGTTCFRTYRTPPQFALKSVMRASPASLCQRFIQTRRPAAPQPGVEPSYQRVVVKVEPRHAMLRNSEPLKIFGTERIAQLIGPPDQTPPRLRR